MKHFKCMLAALLLALSFGAVTAPAHAWPGQGAGVASCCPPNANAANTSWSPLTKTAAEQWVANAFPGSNGASGVVQATANTLVLPPSWGGFPGGYKLEWVGSNNTRRNPDGTVWAYVFIFKWGYPLEGDGNRAYCQFVAHVGMYGGNVTLWNSNIDYVGGSPSTACFYY